MTHLDLFSGIGGFALAAQWAGLTTIGFSEIDPYANRVLAKNFPGVRNYGNIENVRSVHADVVTGGFPCQPFSVAGRRGGARDDRYLWPEMLRVVAESGAAWVVGENVPGIISMALDRVLSDLENLGYAAWPIVVPACAVDAPHRRDRVWIVGHSHGQRREGQHVPIQSWGSLQARPQAAGTSPALADAARGEIDQRERGNLAGPEGCREGEYAAAGSGRANVSDTLRSGREECHAPALAARAGQHPRCAVAGGQCWHPESSVGRVADGIPARVDRLRALGNAIVPQVAYQFLHWIVEAEQNAPEER